MTGNVHPSIRASVTDLTQCDAASFPRLELHTQLCQQHVSASNIPERATRTQHFGSSHSDQHKLKTRQYEPYTVPRVYSLPPMDYYRRPYTQYLG